MRRPPQLLKEDLQVEGARADVEIVWRGARELEGGRLPQNCTGLPRCAEGQGGGSVDRAPPSSVNVRPVAAAIVVVALKAMLALMVSVAVASNSPP